MLKPDATKHNPDPHYLRGLLRRSGLSQRQAAEVMGMPLRKLERNLRDGTKYPADYRTQFALEFLADYTERRKTATLSGAMQQEASPDTVTEWKPKKRA